MTPERGDRWQIIPKRLILVLYGVGPPSPSFLRLPSAAAPPPPPQLPLLRAEAPLCLPLSVGVRASPGPLGRLFVNEMLSFSMEPRGARADAAQAAALALSREGGALSSLARSRPPFRRGGF